jgi:hypothetical protein
LAIHHATPWKRDRDSFLSMDPVGWGWIHRLLFQGNLAVELLNGLITLTGGLL